MLQNHFRPEFLNRIDEIVVFHPLTQRTACRGRRHPAEACQPAAGRPGLPPGSQPGRASEYLAEVGYDPDFGARPLKRTIQRELQDPLALKILAGEFHEGDVIEVDRDKNGLVFTTAVQGEVVEA